MMKTAQMRVFGCACGHEWSVAYGIARPEVCPSCQSRNIHRKAETGGFGGGRGGAGQCRGLRTGLHRQHPESRQHQGQGTGNCARPMEGHDRQ